MTVPLLIERKRAGRMPLQMLAIISITVKIHIAWLSRSIVHTFTRDVSSPVVYSWCLMILAMF